MPTSEIRFAAFCVIFIHSICFIHGNNAQLLPQRRVFDQDLYEQVLDPELCDRHLFLLFNNTVLALPFLDAGIRFPRGFLEGNTVDLGNYHQCLALKHDIANTTVEGKYCSIYLPLNQEIQLPEFPPWPEIQPIFEELQYKIKDYENFKTQVQKLTLTDNPELRLSGVLPGLSAVTLRLAVCIPKTCTSSQVLTSVTAGAIELHEDYCRLPGDKPYVPADYVALSIFSTIGLFIVISTCYDLLYIFAFKKDPKQKSTLYSSFSVYTNTKRLLTFKPGSDSLGCLDGVRAISIMWVIVGHTYTSVIVYVVQNIIEVWQWTQTLNALWIMAAPLSVDTFLMMSGLLSVYTVVKKATRLSFLKNIPLFYLHRYLRIFPLLAAAILLQASLPHRIADGPEWDSVAWDTQNCRDNWWLTLLHVQNYFADGRTCIGQTWYLAVDMQLYWISPLILVWLCAPREGNGHRTGWCAVTLGLLTSLLATSIYCFLNNFPVNSMVRPEDGDWYMDYYYINTLTRAPPFFVGMLYGYALHLWRGKTIVLPKVFVTLMWTATAILMGFSVYIHYPTLNLDYDNQLLDNFLNSYMRATWAIALGWMIFACVHGYGGPINWLLSLQMWKLPARLSYAMYLLHFAPMLTMNSMRVSPIYFTEWDTIFRCFGDLVLSFLLAFIFTLAVDSPFSTLQKLFFERGKNKQQREPASNKNNIDNVHDILKRDEMEAKTIF